MLSLLLYIYTPLVKPFPLGNVHVCLSLSLWTCSWCYFKLDPSFIQAFQLSNVSIHLSISGRWCRSLNLKIKIQNTQDRILTKGLCWILFSASEQFIHPSSFCFPVYSWSGSWGAGIDARSYWMRASTSPWTSHKFQDRTTRTHTHALYQELCIFGMHLLSNFLFYWPAHTENVFRGQEGRTWTPDPRMDGTRPHSVVILSSVLLISVTKRPLGSYARYVRPAVAFPEGPLSEE